MSIELLEIRDGCSTSSVFTDEIVVRNHLKSTILEDFKENAGKIALNPNLRCVAVFSGIVPKGFITTDIITIEKLIDDTVFNAENYLKWKKRTIKDEHMAFVNTKYLIDYVSDYFNLHTPSFCVFAISKKGNRLVYSCHMEEFFAKVYNKGISRTYYIREHVSDHV